MQGLRECKGLPPTPLTGKHCPSIDPSKYCLETVCKILLVETSGDLSESWRGTVISYCLTKHEQKHCSCSTGTWPEKIVLAQMYTSLQRVITKLGLENLLNCKNKVCTCLEDRCSQQKKLQQFKIQLHPPRPSSPLLLPLLVFTFTRGWGPRSGASGKERVWLRHWNARPGSLLEQLTTGGLSQVASRWTSRRGGIFIHFIHTSCKDSDLPAHGEMHGPYYNTQDISAAAYLTSSALSSKCAWLWQFRNCKPTHCNSLSF